MAASGHLNDVSCYELQRSTTATTATATKVSQVLAALIPDILLAEIDIAVSQTQHLYYDILPMLLVLVCMIRFRS